MPTRSSSASTPQMLRGVLFTLSRRCGRENCRCAAGQPHASPALAFPQGGRTRTITLVADEVEPVRRALARYEQARARLDAQAEAGIQALLARQQARRAR